MKTALTALVAFFLGIAFQHNYASTRLKEKAAKDRFLAEMQAEPKAPQHQGPPLVFTGIVSQHIKGGLLIRADNFLEALPKGYTLADINGDFFLVGYPGESNTADGARLTFRAAHGELFTFRSVLGANRTIRKIHYTAPYTSRR
jgi:hypothetical protein